MNAFCTKLHENDGCLQNIVYFPNCLSVIYTVFLKLFLKIVFHRMIARVLGHSLCIEHDDFTCQAGFQRQSVAITLLECELDKLTLKTLLSAIAGNTHAKPYRNITKI